MFTVTKLTTLVEFNKLWPRLSKLARADCPNLTALHLLPLFLRCFKFGAVFIVRGDTGLLGSCLVENGSDFLILHSIPNDKGTGVAKACLEAVKVYAKDKGCVAIKATTQKLSGSSYRYFEKTLGFRRHSVTFQLKL